MAVQKKTITIDGESYDITQLGAVKGRKIWLRLLKTMSALFKGLAAADGLTQEAMLGALADVVDGLDEETCEMMYEAFGPVNLVHEGERRPALTGAIFDQHFAGRPFLMTKWLGENILFNFADFLPAASGSSLQALIAEAAKKLKPPSPKASTGTSGAS